MEIQVSKHMLNMERLESHNFDMLYMLEFMHTHLLHAIDTHKSVPRQGSWQVIA